MKRFQQPHRPDDTERERQPPEAEHHQDAEELPEGHAPQAICLLSRVAVFDSLMESCTDAEIVTSSMTNTLAILDDLFDNACCTTSRCARDTRAHASGSDFCNPASTVLAAAI